jgi:hypothetical protein
MRRRILSAAVVLTAALLAACNDKPLPTAPIVNGPSALGSINSSGLCEDPTLNPFPPAQPNVDETVKFLINGLFTNEVNRQSTLSMWEGIKRDKLDSRPLQNHIDNFAGWVLDKFGTNTLQDPDGVGNETVDYNVTTGTFTLLDQVFRCAGGTPTTLPPVPEGFNAAWTVVEEGTQEEVTTSGGDANGFLPGDALQGSAVLALVFQEDRVNTPFPIWSPTVDVQLVGNGRLKPGKKLSLKLCPREVTDMDYNRLVIAHQRRPIQPDDDVGENVEYLPPAEGGSLDCHDDVGASMWRMEKGFLRQRAAQLAFFAKKAVRFVSPRVLYAGHAAIGGSFEGDEDGRGFSPTVIVDPYVQTAITDVSIPTTVYGTPVVITANLRITGVGVPGDCPATGPRPPACEWVGEPVTQGLEGMPQLVTPLPITATLDDGKTDTENVQADGSVRFEFSNVNAGDDHNAALVFPRTRNQLPALAGSSAFANVPDFDGSSSPTNPFVVQPAPLTITPAGFSRDYGNVTLDSELSGDVVGEVYDEDGKIIATYTTDATQQSYITTATRTYKTMVASVAPLAGSGVLLSNYDITEQEGVFTINQRTLTGDAAPANRQYGEPNPTLGGTVANPVVGFDDGLRVVWVNPSLATTPVGPPGTDPNLYLITAQLTDDPAVAGDPRENYINGITAATLMITQRMLVGGPNAVEPIVYGEPVPATFAGSLNASVGDVLETALVPGDGVTSAFVTNPSAVQFSPVGSYNIVLVLTGAASSNYNVSGVAQGTLQITPRPLTVTVNNVPDAVYGDSYTLGATTNAVNGDEAGFNFAFPTSPSPAINAGTYSVGAVVSGAALANYQSPVIVAGTLVIGKRPLLGDIGDNTKTQGQPNPDPLATHTITNNVAGDGFVVTLMTTATTESPVGNYPITVDLSVAGGANYSWNTANDGNLEVTSGDIPNPILQLTSVERGESFDTYNFTVTNRSSYPAAMFSQFSEGPCGSRTHVDFYSGTTRIYGFCVLSSPDQLNGIWFSIPAGTGLAPVHIKMLDRLTNITYTSNTVELP